MVGRASTEVVVTPRVELWRTLMDVGRFRELFFYLAWRDFHLRYRSTYLGMIWALARPLAISGILAVVSARIAHAQGPAASDVLAAMARWIPFQVFSQAVSSASSNLLGQLPLFGKVYFPRIFTPLTAAAVALLDGLVAVALFGVVALSMGMPALTLAFYGGVAFVATAFLAVGAALLVASVTAQVRDLAQALPFALQCILFASPIAFVVQEPEVRQTLLLLLNPLTLPIVLFQAAVGATVAVAPEAVTSFVLVTAAVFVGGVVSFLRVERRLADLV